MVRAVYNPRPRLADRNMLRRCARPQRLFFAVASEIVDERGVDGRACGLGLRRYPLAGHVERGQMNYAVWKCSTTVRSVRYTVSEREKVRKPDLGLGFRRSARRAGAPPRASWRGMGSSSDGAGRAAVQRRRTSAARRRCVVSAARCAAASVGGATR